MTEKWKRMTYISGYAQWLGGQTAITITVQSEGIPEEGC